MGLLSLVAGSGGWLPGAASSAHKSTSRHIPEDQGKAIARPDDELPSRSIGAERDRTRTAQPGQLKPVELRIPNSPLVGRDSLGVDAPADQQAAAFRVEGHRRGVKAPIVLEESGVHTLEESGRLIAQIAPNVECGGLAHHIPARVEPIPILSGGMGSQSCELQAVQERLLFLFFQRTLQQGGVRPSADHQEQDGQPAHEDECRGGRATSDPFDKPPNRAFGTGKDRLRFQKTSEIRSQSGGGVVPFRRALGHRLENDRLQVGGNLRIQLARRSRLIGRNVGEELLPLGVGKDRRQRQQFVERDPEGINV